MGARRSEAAALRTHNQTYDVSAGEDRDGLCTVRRLSIRLGWHGLRGSRGASSLLRERRFEKIHARGHELAAKGTRS